MYRIYTFAVVLLTMFLCLSCARKNITPNTSTEACDQRFHELRELNFMQTWEKTEAETDNGTLLTYMKQNPPTKEEVVVVAVSNDKTKNTQIGGIVVIMFYVHGKVCTMRPKIP